MKIDEYAPDATTTSTRRRSLEIGGDGTPPIQAQSHDRISVQKVRGQ